MQSEKLILLSLENFSYTGIGPSDFPYRKEQVIGVTVAAF